MLLDWAIHTLLTQKRLSHSYQQSTIFIFAIFLRLRIGIVVLVLQLIWYYSTSWVSNVGDIVLVLIFLFRIIKCGGFFILGIIKSIFLKIGNGWSIVVRYVTNVVCVGTHFFPQFLENSRSKKFLEKTRTNKMRKVLMILRKICLVLPMAIRITRSVSVGISA